MTAGYESILFLLAWYSIAITLFTAILSPVFFSDCISFFSMFAKGILSLFQKFVAGADSFGQLSSGISNSIISGIVYWLICKYCYGNFIYHNGIADNRDWLSGGENLPKYCWDIISIMVVIMSTAIIIYFGKWIKSIIPINLIMLLLLVHCGLYRNPMFM